MLKALIYFDVSPILSLHDCGNAGYHAKSQLSGECYDSMQFVYEFQLREHEVNEQLVKEIIFIPVANDSGKIAGGKAVYSETQK